MMYSSQESSSNTQTDLPYQAASVAPPSATLHCCTSGVNLQGHRASASKMWTTQSSSHVSRSRSESLDPRFRHLSLASRSAKLGRRRSCQETLALQPFRCNTQERRHQPYNLENSGCGLSGSSRTAKPARSFGSSRLNYRRSLILAVGLQTTRCLLKHGF